MKRAILILAVCFLTAHRIIGLASTSLIQSSHRRLPELLFVMETLKASIQPLHQQTHQINIDAEHIQAFFASYSCNKQKLNAHDLFSGYHASNHYQPTLYLKIQTEHTAKPIMVKAKLTHASISTSEQLSYTVELEPNQPSLNEDSVRLMIYLDAQDWAIQSHSDYPTKVCPSCQ